MSEDKLQKTTTYPLSRLSAPFEPNNQELARAEAHTLLGTVTSARLRVLYDQIRHLQEEAQRIIIETEDDIRLHNASCRFTKRPGHIYHLYKQEDGNTYFSMLSPDEWGISPHEYAGSYRLERDMTWTAVDCGQRTVNVKLSSEA